MTARSVVVATPWRAPAKYGDVHDALERVDDAPVDQEVDVDRRVVLGDRRLAGDLDELLAHVDLHRPVDDRDQEPQARPADEALVRSCPAGTRPSARTAGRPAPTGTGRSARTTPKNARAARATIELHACLLRLPAADDVPHAEGRPADGSGGVGGAVGAGSPVGSTIAVRPSKPTRRTGVSRVERLVVRASGRSTTRRRDRRCPAARAAPGRRPRCPAARALPTVPAGGAMRRVRIAASVIRPMRMAVVAVHGRRSAAAPRRRSARSGRPASCTGRTRPARSR